MPSSEQDQVESGYPQHVAIIMDGNGRWAQRRGLPRIKGHEAGAESVRDIMRACIDLRIKYLTLYAFSVENWIRPKDEVFGLMQLLARSLREKGQELHEGKIRLRIIGRTDDLPAPVLAELNKMVEETKEYEAANLVLALSYGGRAEIVDATKNIARKIKEGTLALEDINDNVFQQHLYAPDIPDPDFMIRTSGEMRISNFLLWQLSYAELYVTDVLWPEFRRAHLVEALEEYKRRNRRFGGVSSGHSC